MASRRMIDPNFWQSESLMELDYRQRLLFIGLISNADDQGRLKGNPKLVKAIVFPFDDISADEVQADLTELETVECIAIYKAGSKTCIQILNWWSYQHPQWAYPSELPPMEGWQDQLRYRKGGEIVKDNWKPDNQSKPEPPTGNDLNGSADDCYTHLPKDLPNPLPKETPKASGSSVVLGLDIELEKNPTTTTRTHAGSDEQFGQVTALLTERGLYLDGFTSQLVQECFDDIKPQGDETKLDWFRYACEESAGNKPNWKYFEAIIRGVGDSGSLSAHKANRQTKRKDSNGQRSVNSGKRAIAREARKVKNDPYKDNGQRVSPKGLPIDPELLARSRQQQARPN